MLIYYGMNVVSVSKEGPRRTAEIAVQVLKKGGVVACPTDTVYGLLADARSKKAVRKVFLIKGREAGKPLPVFVSGIAMARRLAKISKTQKKLLKKSWPGKVTFVLQSRGKLPRETGTHKTIGLRMPDHKLVRELLRKTGVPLTGTSANVAGKPALSQGEQVKLEFEKRKHQPDLLLDAGGLSRARPSKVVDVMGLKAKVLRK